MSRSLPPRRLPNSARRTREHLTPAEVDGLLAAAGKVGRYGHRDATALLLAYRHGYRVGELVTLRWADVELDAGRLYVARDKNGSPAVHPMQAATVLALRRLRREHPNSAFVFLSERGAPLTTSAVRKIVQRAGRLAGLGDAVHPHQLRHACGYKLVNDRQDARAIAAYMGFRNLNNVTRYTALAAGRFAKFWTD